MKKNSFKLSLYIFILAFIQILVNNSSKLYLDLIGLVIVVIILSTNYSLLSLLLISIFADLIGHWYLGTHLIASICLTFISKSVTNYFNISTFLHKSITLIFFSSWFLFIIFCIDLVAHNLVINIPSLLIEVFLIAPCILKLLENVLTIQHRDIIF